MYVQGRNNRRSSFITPPWYVQVLASLTILQHDTPSCMGIWASCMMYDDDVMLVKCQSVNVILTPWSLQGSMSS